MYVHAFEREPRDAARARDRLAGVLDREPELRVRLPCRDLVVRLAAHVGRHAHERALRGGVAGSLGEQLAQPLELVEVVDHEQADADVERPGELLAGLRVAVHDDALRGKARGEREVQLAGGGDVAPQALLGKDLEHGGAGERLRREAEVHIVVPRVARGGAKRARAGAQVVLRDDVRRRAERARELDRVASAQLQAPALAHAAAERKDIGQACPRRHPRIMA